MNRLIILTAALIASLSCIAQDDTPKNVFIRPDRVWLCSSTEMGESTAKYMKFTDTKNFMDKTYTRVSTIKKVMWDFQMTNIQIEEDIDETVAWMREENGKVYLLLDGWDHLPYDEDGAPTAGPYEGIIYDFNAEEGSSYEGIAQYRDYEGGEGWYWEGSYRVLSVDKVMVGDEEVKCWNVKFSLKGEEEESIQTYPIVEGVGIVDYGGFYYLETFDHTSGGSYFYNYFKCCMDLDGNVLYPKDYKGDLPGGGLPSAVATLNHSATQTAPIYDILGRRISSPAPGQLYIQAGKKHIAK